MSNPQWVDRRNARRTVPLQVLCLGISRTGTTSMTRALETLGYVKTNHGMDTFYNPYERQMWIEAMNAKFFGKGKLYVREDWDRLLGHCQAVTDAPHYLFARELIEAYPDAKVVLTIRDPDSWWRSASATIGVPIPLLRRVGALIDPNETTYETFVNLTWAALFGTENWRGDAELCKARFTAHYDYVRSLVPAERLLDFNVKEGWGPLCSFLGKEIPDEPFPRLFDTAAYGALMKE
ncbi:P-loop containing nucleoside triphosphate hydrolase protein [Mycena metata]|uniref:P-loop containing nucleoside triphosphate hydrolase protein n=1 Tax=Mycena metata TaxID=1033252 RepID=A0AAD7I0G9_9AGAR|nr:P-loop containing nucleoside triphosphate hydrolase protein [Mycena metata]